MKCEYYTATSSGQLPSGSSPYDRDTRSGTEAHAWYLDDKIDIGNWTITPGMRFELHRVIPEQRHQRHARRSGEAIRTASGVERCLYHLTDSWNLYATNTEARSAPYSTATDCQSKAVQSGNVEPEKARTWELGTRYDDGAPERRKWGCS